MIGFRGCLAGLVGVLGAVSSGSSAEPPASSLYEVRNSEQLRQAIRATGARTLRLEPGNYVVGETLEIRDQSHVNLIGSGWNTTITRTGAGAALVIDDSHFCTVSELMIGGVEGATDGIVFSGKSSSNTVRHCRISGFAGSGIRFDGLKESPMSSNSVLNSHFIDNRGEQLRSFWNNDFYIVGNQFGRWRADPAVGAALIHSSAGSYTLNYHWDNDVAMVLGPGADYNRIENNRFEESHTSGIVIGNPKTADQWNRFNTITGNTIHTNSKGAFRLHDAVVAYDAHDTIFSTNQVFSWYPPTTQHRSGLVLGRGCADWIVTSNIFRHHSASAIVADEAAGHLIKDNLMDTEPWGEP